MYCIVSASLYKRSANGIELSLVADADASCRCGAHTDARTELRHPSPHVQRRRRDFKRETARLVAAHARIGDDSSRPDDVTPTCKAHSRTGR